MSARIPIVAVEAGVSPRATRDDFCGWLRKHGLDPNNIYRVELIDDAYMVVYQFQTSFKGKKFIGDDGGPAKVEPYAVRITEPVPA